MRDPLGHVSRRGREIMDIVYSKGSATSLEVMDVMPNPPSYSAVRALMRILVKKNLLRHRRVGLRYVFEPIVTADDMRLAALTKLMRALFGNSPASLVTTLLSSDEIDISREELKQLKEFIAQKEAEAATEPSLP